MGIGSNVFSASKYILVAHKICYKTSMSPRDENVYIVFMKKKENLIFL